MEPESAHFARRTLHHREVPTRGVVHYLPLRASSHAPRANASLRRRSLDLLTAAMSWVLNEVIEGLAAYANTIHPIVPPAWTLGAPESADRDLAKEHRANSQLREAEESRRPHVRIVMVQSNGWIPPQMGRSAR
jgi:hypothetical protein